MHAAKTQRSVCASYSLIRSSGRWKIASNAELFSLYFVFIRSFNSFIHWVGASFVHTTPMRFFFTHFEQILSLFVSLFFILIFFFFIFRRFHFLCASICVMLRPLSHDTSTASSVKHQNAFNGYAAMHWLHSFLEYICARVFVRQIGARMSEHNQCVLDRVLCVS